jgi:hypothetical protein
LAAVSVTLALGKLRNLASLYEPGPPVNDGLGGYTTGADVALDPPEWWCRIEKAALHAAERRFAATVTAKATHIFSGRFHEGITSRTIVVWRDRAGVAHRGNVLDYDDTEGAGVETLALVSEVGG